MKKQTKQTKQAKQARQARQEENNRTQERIDPHLILLCDPALVKVVEDNPNIPVGKVDIGRGLAHPYGQWQPLNYDPETGKMND